MSALDKTCQAGVLTFIPKTRINQQNTSKNCIFFKKHTIFSAKKNIANSISSLKSLQQRKPNSILLKILFDSKSDEIKDIFEKFNEVDDADYFIYTNVDIALMPYFYNVVFDYIKAGHDAIIINRRRLNKHYSSPNELQFMYADLGKSHPGFDCFIFNK